MSKSAEIREYLLKHYPCQAIPHGHLTEIGEKFGVTRELVRQVANRNGITGRLSVARITTCGGCGKEMASGSKSLCYECRWVELLCAFCGKPKRVRPAELAWRVAKEGAVKTPWGVARYSGAVYCDRVCLGRAMGKRNQRLTPQEPVAGSFRHGTFTGYSYHKCRCADCLEAMRSKGREAYARSKK